MTVTLPEPTQETTKPPKAATSVEELPIELIRPAKDNPRRGIGNIDELAASIAAVGLLEPLVVMPHEGAWLLVCGSRRLVAAKKAGLKTVPVLARQFTETERQEAMLIENLQRTDLTVLEEARAYARLTELGSNQRELAKRVGRSQSHISKRVGLLQLPEAVAGEIDSGGITIEDALELVRLADHPARLKKVLKRPSWETVAGAVRKELAAIEAEEKVAKARAALEKKGIRVVAAAADQSAYWFRTPEGVFKIGDGWDELPLDVKKHAAEPCHAVGIEPRTGDTVPLCTDRKRHPKVKTQEEKNSHGQRSNTAVDKRYVEKQAQRRLAREQREAFIAQLLEKKTPLAKAEAVDLFVRTILRVVEYEPDTSAKAAAWLNLMPAVDLSETVFARVSNGTEGLHVVEQEIEIVEGTTFAAWCGSTGEAADIRRPAERKADPSPKETCPECLVRLIGAADERALALAFQSAIERSEGEALRIGVALCLAQNEEFGEWGCHAALLERQGYKLSPTEREELKG